MAVNSRSSVKQNVPARPVTAPPPPSILAEMNVPGRKKKKKKDKVKTEMATEEDDDDEPPPLEPNPPRATGLSPELEASHLSTNSASDGATQATREEPQPNTNERYNPSYDPPGALKDVDALKGLPSQTCEYIPAAHAPVGELSKAQTMYAIAQQMIRTGTKGASKGLPGSYPLEGVPFDPAVLSDPAIRRSLEAAFNTANANGALRLPDPSSV